ncbi:MAG TPA: HDIG domain-containing metalloprotein, partial [Thermosynechococcaceae cyanobacterium]
VPTGTETIATNLLLASLQPNLVHDETQTRLSAERAAQDVKPEMVAIKQDEAIVYVGESITTADFALLDHFKLSRRGVDWVGLLGFGIVVGGAIGVYWLVERRFHPGMRRRDRILIVLLTLSTPLLVALNVPSTNLSAIGLLVGSFYGSPLGITVAVLLALCLPLGTVLPWSHLLSSAAGGILCGYMAGRLRSREELALLGAAVGVLQGALYLVLNVVSGVGIYTLLGATVIHGLIGLAWSIVAIGVSPYLEQLFDLVTTIRLVELSNPNRSLLKKLAAKTPGTFQHTLFVATLAEAAARALGCNVELVRTGTLYHDIGKMHDPLGFIENQMGGPNKHDLIDDPWKSAEIIKKHVTEGIVMARKYRLPKAVQSFIPEHQGTMLIAYFYHQAQQRSQEAVAQGKPALIVKDADFQYDGPAPQSRETGVVMLADSCEAALRSLKDATPKEALSMINKILRARWQDKQLVNSGLTRDDMSKIATVFVEVWQQSNHQRIAYPSKPISIQPSAISK